MTTVFKQVGPYEILRQIGHGGMAVVFLALDTRAKQRVALKLVQQGTDREAQEIVEAEQFGAELQKRFSERGAHVPAVYEYGIDQDSGYFYVAMEYLDGENLSEVVSHGPLPPARAAEIAVELARFLEDAHAFEAVINGRNLQSLLHLDLKPRNVRITSAQEVKVLDFGTAKALSLSRKVTRNDFGSVAYLSPERLETGEVDARADLWALGVVLYEMLRGAPPFQAADTRRLERLILARRPPPSLMERCPAGLAAIVSKLLDPRSSERYASAREIREDLERFKAGRQTRAEEAGWPARAYDDAATRRTVARRPAAGWRRRMSMRTRRAARYRRLSRAPVAVPPQPPISRGGFCAATGTRQEGSAEPVRPSVSRRAAAGWPWADGQRVSRSARRRDGWRTPRRLTGSSSCRRRGATTTSLRESQQFALRRQRARGGAGRPDHHARGPRVRELSQPVADGPRGAVGRGPRRAVACALEGGRPTATSGLRCAIAKAICTGSTEKRRSCEAMATPAAAS